MLKNKDKKGFVGITVTLGMIIVVAILIALLVGGIGLFLSKNFLAIIGGSMIILTIVFGLRGKLDRTKGIFMFIFVVLGLFLLMFSGQISQSITSGYTSLSISDVDIVDQGERIRIYGVANGAEQISINFNPSEINQYIQNEGYSATESVTGSITLVDPTREFIASKDTSKNFFKIGYYELSLFRNCDNNKPSGVTEEVYRVANTNLCAYQYPVGTYSNFRSGVYSDSAPVNVNIGGASGTMDASEGSPTLTLNDGKTRIEWTGNLLNYQGLNTPGYAVLFAESEYQRLIDENAWNIYSDILTNYGLENGIGFWTSSSTAKESIDQLNNDIDQFVLADKTNEYRNLVNVEDLDFTNNGMEVGLTTPTVFPTFIITLDASDVGIIELSGTPDIISCVSDKQIQSGDTYNTDVRVKNIGSSDGSFYGQLNCNGQSDASGVVTERYVESGETINMPIQVSGTNTQSGTQSNDCKITITDRKSGDSDTCNFDLDVEYQPNLVCSPGSKTCKDVNTLKICNSDGTSFTTENCDLGCTVLESGEGICKTESGETPSQKECEWYEQEVPAGTRESCGLFGWKKPLGLCKTETYEASCKTADWLLYSIGGIVILGLGAIAFLPNKKKRKRK